MEAITRQERGVTTDLKPSSSARDRRASIDARLSRRLLRNVGDPPFRATGGIRTVICGSSSTVFPGSQEPTGYSYYLRGSLEGLRSGNAFLTGDSAHLATRDLCEGIGPAIRSGQRAANAILSGYPYTLDGATGASLGRGLFSRWMDWAFTCGAS